MNREITFKFKAEGIEEVTDQIEEMADAIDALPAAVNIKAKDCEIYVSTYNNIEMPEPKKQTTSYNDKALENLLSNQ